VTAMDVTIHAAARSDYPRRGKARSAPPPPTAAMMGANSAPCSIRCSTDIQRSRVARRPTDLVSIGGAAGAGNQSNVSYLPAGFGTLSVLKPAHLVVA
jgi:hypothetical protein